MIHIVLGTRSEVIKLSSVIRELKKRRIDFKIIHTGQHDTLHLMNMLKLPKPDHYLGKSLREKWSKKGKVLGAVLALYWGLGVFLKLRRIFYKEKPCIIIYNGNTAAVPLTALAARTTLFSNTILVHRESGMRNYRKQWFSEDFYYRIGERYADILFCPVKEAVENLKKEGVDKNKKIFYSQDPHVEIIQEILNSTKTVVREEEYLLVNTIRSIDTREKAKEFTEILLNSPFKVTYSVNPKIRCLLERNNFLTKLQNAGHIKVCAPIEYPIFLHLMKNAVGIMTDSGGVIGEVAIFNKPCIVLNEWSQYPELERRGLIEVTGIDKKRIMNLLEDIKSEGDFYKRCKRSGYSPGDGKATERMVDILERCLNER